MARDIALRVAFCGAFVALSSCGSRSNLDVGGSANTGGSGGAATSSATSTTSTLASGGGGSGGSGGSFFPEGECAVLQLAGPEARLDGGFDTHQHFPTWVLSSDDGSRVTLLSGWQAAEGPPDGDFSTSIVHTSLYPWVNFPSGDILGANFTADANGGESFAAARSVGNRFALLSREFLTPPGGLVFSNNYVPEGDQSPSADLVDGAANTAVFVAQNGSRHLLGVLRPASPPGGNGYQLAALIVDGDNKVTASLNAGCAAAPMLADAVAANGGFLMAMSNGGPFGEGDCLNSDLGWPDEVQIAIVKDGGATNTDFFGAPGGATDVKMARRSDGAWLVVGTPPGQVVSAMALGARIDLNGKVVSTFQVGGGDTQFEILQDHTITAANVGDYLVVAWVDYAGDKGPFIHVKSFDPNGTPAGQLQVFAKTSVVGAPVLLGSPVSNSLVLAWSQTPESSTLNGDGIRAVRIDCISP